MAGWQEAQAEQFPGFGVISGTFMCLCVTWASGLTSLAPVSSSIEGDNNSSTSFIESWALHEIMSVKLFRKVAGTHYGLSEN